MNKDQMEGNWKQLKGKVKEQWGKLTDNDLTVVEGNMDQLAGRVQERYGVQRDEAEKQIKEFRKRDRKSTRLNSSHSQISYAVFCLKKKKKKKKKNKKKK